MTIAVLIVSILLIALGIFAAIFETIFMKNEIVDIKEEWPAIAMGSLLIINSLGMILVGILMINTYVL